MIFGVSDMIHRFVYSETSQSEKTSISLPLTSRQLMTFQFCEQIVIRKNDEAYGLYILLTLLTSANICGQINLK
jgi:hypothetical protein